MSILKKIEKLQEIKGYLGAAVFNPEGKMLGGVTDVAGINFEIAGSLFHDLFLITRNQTREAGFGETDIIMLYTKNGIIMGQSFDEEDVHFHTILALRNDANIAMAKLLLSKTQIALRKVIEALEEKKR
ncbi:MAG: hypothetical protein KAW12_22875 [Candidatus Aminicenantes bacterium]|nr:hypothetical protein [Candidatus Aminicenantes bacterium]